MEQITIGLPKGALKQHDTCKGCTLAKYTKVNFHDWDTKAHAVLERIHFDVYGHFSTTSTSRHKYFVTLIDYFSRKCWIFFIQKKDETLSMFLEFKALVDKEVGKKVKVVRTDNGGEYVSNELKKRIQKKEYDES